MLLMGEAGLYMTLLALLSKVMQYRYLKESKSAGKSVITPKLPAS